MNFKGNFEVGASPERVYALLTDPNELAKCLPDLQSLDVKGGDEFGARFKIGIAAIRGGADFRFRIVDTVPTKHARMIGHGTGLQSVMDLDVKFDLTSIPVGTRVDWVAEVNVGGLLAGVGSKLLQTGSDKQIQKLVSNIRKKLT